jgi:eukaryotic-like serine/threonine-protein kinase
MNPTVTHREATASFEPVAGNCTVTRAGGEPVASGYEEELRRLLRSRLILVHLLAFVYIALLAGLSALFPIAEGQDPNHRPDQGNPWTLVPSLTQCVIGVVILWRSPRMSLKSLRLWEFFHFTTAALFYGLLRFEMLAYVDGGSPNPPSIMVGAAGGFSLFGFITLILAYGVLIPNTRRRSLLAVAGLTAVPFAALVAGVAANPALGSYHFLRLVIQAAANLTFPAAIAVFASVRAAALQRRAFDAERRAEQVGQYTLKRKLGGGGMGEVFLAEHRLLKRPCAVKFIRPELASHTATAARFTREVQAVTGLTHFNTVRIYDYGKADDGRFYYVMEYLDGPTLDGLVKQVGPLAPERVIDLMKQLCGALAEAHAAGLVHRDIKPGNIIVATLGGQRDVAKLLDFGLVQDQGSSEGDGRLTHAGTVLGTPAYMCPEQAGGTAVDARGDLYSLGAVAFFSLTGRPPFERDSVGAYLMAHLTQHAPDVTEIRKNVPADLAAVIARCLAKEPAGRYQTAAGLAEALDSCGYASARLAPDGKTVTIHQSTS